VGSHPIDLEGEWRYQLGAASAAMAAPAFVAHRQPLGFYNAMLAPLQNMTIKGVIWYQGESNVERAKEYATLFPALIRDWRKKWRQGDFPFLFVQLANYLEAADAPGDSDWAELRNAQSAALSEPNTAMAVAIDIGEWNDIHPQNKRDVGERLALAARKVAYGESGLLSAGPAFRSLEAETRNGRLRVHFDNVGGGLSARGDRPGGFDIAGADRVYVRATARIDGDSVVVWSDAVADPMMLRYGWADNPVDANLCNSAGLPASPFRARLAD
jgi:sialate O-acetylesterase